MRILIVANYNKNSFAPFIVEQVEALRKLGVEIEYFGVLGKGIQGYLSNLNPLKERIIEYQPDLIHAHYGLSGLLANLQRNVPVVTTYHGSDIHSGGKPLFFSKQSIRLSVYNIFVSEWLLKESGYQGYNKCVIPCGVDTEVFLPKDRIEARQKLGWDVNGKYVLFASAFDNEVKNSPLAMEATAMVKDAQLVELNNYSREEVSLAMNASNCLLMTSHREGSPQVVKETMACGTPIVSVDVADVKEITEGIEGCYITTYDATNVADCIRKALNFQGKTNGRQRIFDLELSNDFIGRRIEDVYELSMIKK